MKRVYYFIAFGISLLLSLGLPAVVARADGPMDGLVQTGEQTTDTISPALSCLAVGAGAPASASGAVNLNWQGQVVWAQLVLNAAGAEAPHTIKVNGQPVATVPLYPEEGIPCQGGEYFAVTIPAQVLVQGENRIELTNDALPGDSWSAVNVALRVLTGAGTGSGQAEMTVSAQANLTITFTSSYDSSSQQARVQIPDAYAGAPTPLVVVLHGRTSSMEWGISAYGAAVNAKGWLLASPQLHGSWVVPPAPPGAYAYASLESQSDVIDTVRYMVQHYNVKPDQIYLVGESMGSQVATVTAAKYPYLFAAVFDNKGPVDFYQWYFEQSGDFFRNTMREECHIGGVPQTPQNNPFCYQRRSSVNFASNYIHTPISITHSLLDVTVPITTHSLRLRDRINSYNPVYPASVFVDTVQAPTCPPNYHCYQPDPDAVLNFLAQYTLNSNPAYVYITTDQSKPYYWFNITQTGGDHWSQVQANYSLITKTVTAIISDTQPLTLGFNLGATPIVDIVSSPGMGLPSPATYLVKGGGHNTLRDYGGSGYLNINLPAGSNYNLTVSAITPHVSASPATVVAAPGVTSTITAQVTDGLGNPVPDGTPVVFSTSRGTFSNGNSVYNLPSSGGQAAAVLTPGPAEGFATVTVTVGLVTGTTSVHIDDPTTGQVYLPLVVKG